MTNTSRPINRSVLWRLTPALAAVPIIVATSLPAAAALPPGNPVQQWNKIAEDVVVGSGAFQNEGLIYMAYVSAAVYDAVTAIEGGYEPYGSWIATNPRASVEAAVAEAAYTTLRYYFPAQRHRSTSGAARRSQSFRTRDTFFLRTIASI